MASCLPLRDPLSTCALLVPIRKRRAHTKIEIVCMSRFARRKEADIGIYGLMAIKLEMVQELVAAAFTTCSR